MSLSHYAVTSSREDFFITVSLNGALVWSVLPLPLIDEIWILPDGEAYNYFSRK